MKPVRNQEELILILPVEILSCELYIVKVKIPDNGEIRISRRSAVGLIHTAGIPPEINGKAP